MAVTSLPFIAAAVPASLKFFPGCMLLRGSGYDVARLPATEGTAQRP